MSAEPISVLAIADSDSYLKLSAAMLDALADHVDTLGLAVVRSPIAPSPTQVRAALVGTGKEGHNIPVLTILRIQDLVRRERPDVVVLNCTGPVVDVIASMLLSAGPGYRPVLVSALPGISVPATEKAWLYRSQIDLFVLHSRREVAEFTVLGEELGAGGEVGLATLPFLPPVDAGLAQGNRVVFASQAKVPTLRGDREKILVGLADLAEERSDLEVVVKLRGDEHEAQTHRERYHYRALWWDLVRRGRVREDALHFRTGPMSRQLSGALGLVTVSSTAALEAIALRVPLLVLTDFGVGSEQINTVFEGSGTFGTLEDVRAARFRSPGKEWLDRNHFHQATDNDWIERLEALVSRARGGGLAVHPSLRTSDDQLRSRRNSLIRLSVPPSALRTTGFFRSRLRALRTSAGSTLRRG